MPLRSLTNVEYDPKIGYFQLKGDMKTRTLTANTVKTFAQTLRMMSFSKELINTDDIATKREAYYISKNWGDARFKEQVESDTLMDDFEAMMMLNREQLGFIPEEKGGGLGVENALGLRLLSEMLKTPSDTLFCCSLLSRIGR